MGNDAAERQRAALEQAKAVLERLGALEDAVGVVSGLALVPDASRLSALTATIGAIKTMVGRMRATDPGAGVNEQRVKSIEQALVAAEGRFSELEAQIPMAAFRRQFAQGRFSQEALGHYVGLIVRWINDGPDRVDRIEFLLTRMVSTVEEGRTVVRPWPEVEALLERLLPAEDVGFGLKKEARDKFRSAIEELDQHPTPDALIESEFVKELVRYKRKIGRALFHPPIFYACAQLNVAISNQIEQTQQPAGDRVFHADPEFDRMINSVAKATPSADTVVARMFNTARDAVAREDSAGTLLPDDKSPRHAWDRYLVFSDALHVLFALAPDIEDPRLAELDEAGRALRRMAADLRKSVPDASLDAFTAALEAAQQQLLEVEALMPMSVFRRKFNPEVFAREAVTRYVRILMSDVDQGGRARWDRIEYLISRMLSVRDLDGRQQVRPKPEAMIVLEAVLPQVDVRPGIQAKAIRDVDELAGDAVRAENLDQIFEGGIYRRIQEHKISLGKIIMDLEVLYAVVRLNVTLLNRVEELLEEESTASRTVGDRLDKTQQEVRQAFRGAPLENTDVRRLFEAERRKIRGDADAD